MRAEVFVALVGLNLIQKFGWRLSIGMENGQRTELIHSLSEGTFSEAGCLGSRHAY